MSLGVSLGLSIAVVDSRSVTFKSDLHLFRVRRGAGFAFALFVLRVVGALSSSSSSSSPDSELDSSSSSSSFSSSSSSNYGGKKNAR